MSHITCGIVNLAIINNNNNNENITASLNTQAFQLLSTTTKKY